MNPNRMRSWSSVKQEGKAMRKHLICFLLLCGGTLYGQSASEQFILALSRKKFDWLIAKNYDSLRAVLDDKVQYIHSNGWIQNKQEVLDDMRSGKLVYQQVTVKEVAVRLYEHAAVVTGLGTFEGVNGGTAFKLDLRYTEVYVKSKSGWLLASRHANRMP